jgi:hypothetical protein
MPIEVDQRRVGPTRDGIVPTQLDALPADIGVRDAQRRYLTIAARRAARAARRDRE